MKIKPKLVDYSLLKPKTPPKPKLKPKAKTKPKGSDKNARGMPKGNYPGSAP